MNLPLLLLPGFMTDIRIWGPQIEALAPGRAVHLGHWGEHDELGEMADAVLADAPPRFALAGPSLGGMVAMEMLGRAPERVDRVALLTTGCLRDPPTLAAERDLRRARVSGGRLDEVMRSEVPADALGRADMRDALGDFLAEMARGLGAEAYLRQSRALQRRPDQQRHLREARCPGLVLGGVDDRLYLPARHDFMARLMRHAELCLVDGAGHMPTLEQPDAVTDALIRWLSRDAPPAAMRDRP